MSLTTWAVLPEQARWVTPSSVRFKAEEILENQGFSFKGEIPDLNSLIQDFSGSSVTVQPPLNADFDISVGSEDFLLMGHIQGSFQLACSRCLSAFSNGFRQELESVFPRSSEDLDVGEEIRQALVLAVPAKPVCGENCKGLCPQCGSNWNLSSCACKDPSSSPFSKLQGLLDKKIPGKQK